MLCGLLLTVVGSYLPEMKYKRMKKVGSTQWVFVCFFEKVKERYRYMYVVGEVPFLGRVLGAKEESVSLG